MAGIVHVDETAEELEHLDREVEQRGRATTGTEVLGTLADLDDLVVASYRVDRLHRLRQDVLDLDRQDPALLADLGELGHAVLEGLVPVRRLGESGWWSRHAVPLGGDGGR